MKERPKITILSGIAGSGKSTYAKEQFEKDPLGTIIVNRDKIRELLYGYTELTIDEYYSKGNIQAFESQVTTYQNAIIRTALSKGKNVIIDNTNLSIKYIKEFYDFFGSFDIEVKFFHCDTEEAVKRMSNRTRKVSLEVIKKQFLSFREIEKNYVKFMSERQSNLSGSIYNDPTKPFCIVFDIDGTLAIKGERGIFELDKVNLDRVNVPVGYMFATILYNNVVLSAYPQLNKLGVTRLDPIICSGREDSCREATSQWLKAKLGGDYKKLYMRKAGDMRSDYIVKEEFWREICSEYYILAMFDDRVSVVDRARQLGFTVFQVAEGMF